MRNRIVEIAVSQLNITEPTGDDKYIQWYNGKTNAGFPMDTPWCQIFVAWCAGQAGVPETVIPVTASCTLTMNWFKADGSWHEREGFMPRAGDLIYFDWDGSGDCDHVGIVRSADGNRVTDIEGNASGNRDGVWEKTYALSDKRIRGYARPRYTSLPSDWAQEATAWAVEQGIFQGDERGEMDWQGPVTREALAVTLYRYAQNEEE